MGGQFSVFKPDYNKVMMHGTLEIHSFVNLDNLKHTIWAEDSVTNIQAHVLDGYKRVGRITRLDASLYKIGFRPG